MSRVLLVLLVFVQHVLCLERIILSHHKTGTVLSRKVKKILQDIAPPIKTMGNGLGKTIIPYDAAIIHLMRNPFSMILSAYFYHKTTMENWVHCRSNSIRYSYCPYVYDKYNTVQQAWSYVVSDLKGKIAIVREDGETETLHYPDFVGHSYQTYLNAISPQHGVLLELIRANQYDLPSMVSDFDTVQRRAAVRGPARARGESRNMCLGNLFGVGPGGVIYNSMEEIVSLVKSLNIKITPLVNQALKREFNRTAASPNPHQTNHTTSSRGKLEHLMRAFDKRSFDGLLHQYEKVLNCAPG